MLSPNQLTSQQEAVNNLCSTPCSIQRAVRVEDALGSWTNAWREVALATCYLEEGRIREVEIGGRLYKGRVWEVTLPAGADVKDHDRLVIGDQTLTVFQTNTGNSINQAVEAEAVEL